MELSKNEKEFAKQWRVRKCGWDCFEHLKRKFSLDMEEREIKERIKEEENGREETRVDGS